MAYDEKSSFLMANDGKLSFYDGIWWKLVILWWQMIENCHCMMACDKKNLNLWRRVMKYGHFMMLDDNFFIYDGLWSNMTIENYNFLSYVIIKWRFSIMRHYKMPIFYQPPSENDHFSIIHHQKMTIFYHAPS